MKITSARFALSISAAAVVLAACSGGNSAQLSPANPMQKSVGRAMAGNPSKRFAPQVSSAWTYYDYNPSGRALFPQRAQYSNGIASFSFDPTALHGASDDRRQVAHRRNHRQDADRHHHSEWCHRHFRHAKRRRLRQSAGGPLLFRHAGIRVHQLLVVQSGLVCSRERKRHVDGAALRSEPVVRL